MHYDDEDISTKSPMWTLVFCLFLGQFGVHRFYFGKYFTGLIYLIIGGTSIVLDIMGFGFAFVIKILYLFLIVLDVYALYSDSFTDSKGRLLSDSKALIYKDLKDRERILSERRDNKILCILIAFIVYVTYFLLDYYVF